MEATDKIDQQSIAFAFAFVLIFLLTPAFRKQFLTLGIHERFRGYTSKDITQ